MIILKSDFDTNSAMLKIPVQKKNVTESDSHHSGRFDPTSPKTGHEDQNMAPNYGRTLPMN